MVLIFISTNGWLKQNENSMKTRKKVQIFFRQYQSPSEWRFINRTITNGAFLLGSVNLIDFDFNLLLLLSADGRIGLSRSVE